MKKKRAKHLNKWKALYPIYSKKRAVKMANLGLKEEMEFNTKAINYVFGVDPAQEDNDKTVISIAEKQGDKFVFKQFGPMHSLKAIEEVLKAQERNVFR